MLSKQLVITMLVDDDFDIDSFKNDNEEVFNEVVSVVETVHIPNLIKIGNVFGNVPAYVENIKKNKTIDVSDGPVTDINIYVEMKAICAIVPSREHTLSTITSNGIEYAKDIYLGLNGKTLEAYDILPDEITLAITNGAKNVTIDEYLNIVNKKPVTKKTKISDVKPQIASTTKGKKK